LFNSTIYNISSANHPGGSPPPSCDDEDITRQIIEASKILGIAVLDHLIIGEDCYNSMNDSSDMWLFGGASPWKQNQKCPIFALREAVSYIIRSI
jgi:hypothetical protein